MIAINFSNILLIDFSAKKADEVLSEVPFMAASIYLQMTHNFNSGI